MKHSILDSISSFLEKKRLNWLSDINLLIDRYLKHRLYWRHNRDAYNRAFSSASFLDSIDFTASECNWHCSTRSNVSTDSDLQMRTLIPWSTIGTRWGRWKIVGCELIWKKKKVFFWGNEILVDFQSKLEFVMRRVMLEAPAICWSALNFNW